MRQPAATIVREVGSLGDDTRKTVMGIDPNNYGHLLSLLTDLYSDPILAVIREYSTNARDAHIAAGSTAPIEVTLPTSLSPYLIIRDFGIGMSGDDVIDTYSKYGSSTKRDSDDFNGMLGIGAKSALTYTNTVTIVSVKNGEKIIVSVSRNGNESTMEIVDLTETTEPNGVTVTIPVKGTDMGEFRQKAEYLFSFWPEDSVLVNGAAPKRIDLTHITGEIYTANNLGTDVVVMGGVPYPADNRLFTGVRNYSNRFNVVAFVEIGEVAFTPSREALMYTKHTEATIERIRTEFEAAIQGVIVADIEAAPTHDEAYDRMINWESKYPSVMPNPVMYKGIEIPKALSFMYSSWDKGGYRGGWQSGHTRINVSTLRSAVLIYGFDVQSLTKTHKAKIEQWMNKQGIYNYSKVIFTASLEGGVWIPKDRVVSWNDIKAERLPSTANGGRSGKVPIKVYDTSGQIVSMEDLDEDAIPVYISPTARITDRAALRIYKAMPWVQVCVLGENRWEKFKRENPKAVSLRSAIQAQFNALRDALTPEDIQFLTMDEYYVKPRLNWLEANQIEDPALFDLVKMAKGEYTSANAKAYTEFLSVCSGFVGVPALPESDGISLEDYPLLPQRKPGNMKTIDHVYMYLNAAYAASLNKE